MECEGLCLHTSKLEAASERTTRSTLCAHGIANMGEVTADFQIYSLRAEIIPTAMKGALARLFWVE